MSLSGARCSAPSDLATYSRGFFIVSIESGNEGYYEFDPQLHQNVDQQEIIHVADDDEGLPRRDTEKGTAAPTASQTTAQKTPPSKAPQVLPAPNVTAPLGQGSSQAGADPVAASSTALATAPTPPVNIFNLYRVPEDQTGASKEAMIQADLMT